MEIAEKPLEELVKELPLDVLPEVRDFIESLIAKRESQTGRFLKQDWAGALREFRHQYTALELQHQATEWRID